MKKNYKNIVLIVAVCILCVIFVDLIFNFSSSIIKNHENFIVNDGFFKPNVVASDNIEIKDAQSIMSEDGIVYNIEVVKGHPNETSDHMNIRLNAVNDQYIGLDENGKLGFYRSSDDPKRYTWSIIKVKNAGVFAPLFRDGIIYNHNPHNPFHIVYFPALYEDTTKKMKLVLANNKNNKTTPLSIQNLDYSMVQRWWVNDKKTSHIRDETGAISSESIDPNKLNIKLNIQDPELKKFIKGLQFTDNYGYDTQNTCDYMSRDTIENGCAGCELDKLPIKP